MHILQIKNKYRALFGMMLCGPISFCRGVPPALSSWNDCSTILFMWISSMSSRLHILYKIRDFKHWTTFIFNHLFIQTHTQLNTKFHHVKSHNWIYNAVWHLLCELRSIPSSYSLSLFRPTKLGLQWFRPTIAKVSVVVVDDDYHRPLIQNACLPACRAACLSSQQIPLEFNKSHL